MTDGCMAAGAHARAGTLDHISDHLTFSAALRRLELVVRMQQAELSRLRGAPDLRMPEVIDTLEAMNEFLLQASLGIGEAHAIAGERLKDNLKGLFLVGRSLRGTSSASSSTRTE